MGDQNGTGCDVCIVQLPIICHRVHAHNYDGSNQDSGKAEPDFEGILHRPASHIHLTASHKCKFI